MAARQKLTPAEFAALVDAADELAHSLQGAEGRWPFGLENPPFEDLERHAQTINRLAESALGFQRMIIGAIALAADERRIRKQLSEGV